jgi:phosphocarrier protein
MAMRTAKIGDPVGLHLRAASRIVQVAKRFQSEIRIAYGGVETNAKSILGLASLVARFAEPVDVIAEGPDEAAALDALVHLIEVELAQEV